MVMFGGKWLGEKGVVVHAEWDDSHEAMAKHLWSLYDEADLIVAYNGDRFDDKKAKTLFEQYGLGRPSPYKTVDPFKVAKKHLDLPSYKMDEVLKFYGLPTKIETQESLWTDLLRLDLAALYGDDEAEQDRIIDDGVKARGKMRKYQKQDVVVLESLWYRLRPYIPALPAHVFGPNACDKCGSTRLQRRGYRLTQSGKYERYQCQDCAAWLSGRKMVDGSEVHGL
jgi:hypothetical protein